MSHISLSPAPKNDTRPSTTPGKWGLCWAAGNMEVYDEHVIYKDWGCHMPFPSNMPAMQSQFDGNLAGWYASYAFCGLEFSVPVMCLDTFDWVQGATDSVQRMLCGKLRAPFNTIQIELCILYCEAALTVHSSRVNRQSNSSFSTAPVSRNIALPIYIYIERNRRDAPPIPIPPMSSSSKPKTPKGLFPPKKALEPLEPCWICWIGRFSPSWPSWVYRQIMKAEMEIFGCCGPWRSHRLLQRRHLPNLRQLPTDRPNPVYILCMYCVYIVYTLCIYCVYIVYILCIYCVYIVYILCIYCVYIYIYCVYIYIYCVRIYIYIVYILCIYIYIVYIYCIYIYCVYIVYILCIYCVYIVYILRIYCVYIWCFSCRFEKLVWSLLHKSSLHQFASQTNARASLAI